MANLIIPAQFNGGSHDIVSMHCASTLKQAINNYEILKNRLYQVNTWHTLSEKIKAKFMIVNSDSLETTVFKEGNYVKIDIPGPGSPSGGGYDWTIISDIQEQKENEEYQFFAFTLRPCAPPDADNTTVSHFYSAEATNTFVIRRLGTCVYIEIHGRNQTENTSDVPVLDVLRNKAIAVGGNFGIGYLNWAGFASAFMEPMER